MPKGTVIRDAPRTRIPTFQQDAAALMRWANQSFDRRRKSGELDLHAARLREGWVRELGGARQVTAQQASLLRLASYCVAFADACWVGLQAEIVTDPRLLLEPTRVAAHLLAQVGLRRVAQDAQNLRNTSSPSGLLAWAASEPDTSASPRSNSDQGDDAPQHTSSEQLDAPRHASLGATVELGATAAPHPGHLAAPPARGGGVPAEHTFTRHSGVKNGLNNGAPANPAKAKGSSPHEREPAAAARHTDQGSPPAIDGRGPTGAQEAIRKGKHRLKSDFLPSASTPWSARRSKPGPPGARAPAARHEALRYARGPQEIDKLSAPAAEVTDSATDFGTNPSERP